MQLSEGVSGLDNLYFRCALFIFPSCDFQALGTALLLPLKMWLFLCEPLLYNTLICSFTALPV